MKKMKSIVLLSIVTLSMILFISSSNIVQPFYARPWEDPDPDPVGLDIRNMGTDTQADVYLQGRTTELIVQAEGTFDYVYYSIDTGAAIQMTLVPGTGRYFASVNLGVALGDHTINAWTEDNGVEVESDTAIITVVGDYVASLYYEIDYMVGLEPPQALLDYWSDYWHDRAIDFTYKVDDAIPYASVVSDLFVYEAQYNDWEFQAQGTADDRTSTGTYVYDSQEKWMLFGSADSSSSTGGYTYVDVANHRGNYIMICCDMISSFEISYGIPTNGALTVVTMHEAGHSIGVLIVTTKGRGQEVYDQADKYDIMSTMWPENGGFVDHWYYAVNYWTTRNLSWY
ncbi:MAG: hypothetical protein KGD64_01980 [Candidatus Heimdallarchaeota archaeon]|nr:hypothetical protein [Candidatus Heimdallarchaeota archaeon]